MVSFEQSMRTHSEEVRDIRRQWFAIFLIAVAALMNIATWSVLLWKIPYSAEPILLHYNVYFGIDLTGPWAQMFWIPGSGLLIGAIHTSLVVFMPLQNRIIGWILLVMSVIIQAMALLASLLVVLLNSTL